VTRRDLIGQLVDHEQRIARHGLGVGAAVVGVVLVLERERAVGADTSREVGVAARHQHQVAVQRAILADRTSAIQARMESIARAQQLQAGPFGDELGRRAGDEQLVGVEREQRGLRVEIVERDAEARAAVLGPTDHLLHALGERAGDGPRERLSAPLRGEG